MSDIDNMSTTPAEEKDNEIFAATYGKTFAYHQEDIPAFIEKAAIHHKESVLDLGTGIGWVAAAARHRTTGQIVGVDRVKQMIAEAQQNAKDQALQITYKVGDMITLEGLDDIKPSGGFDVITCLWAFSLVPVGLRMTMLQRWKDFLAPNGRIVLEWRHPDNDIASFDLETELGKPVLECKFLDLKSIDKCAVYGETLGNRAGIELVGEILVKGYEENLPEDNLPLLYAFIKEHNPSPAEVNKAKCDKFNSELAEQWAECGEPGMPVVRANPVSLAGVWQRKVEAALPGE